MIRKKTALAIVLFVCFGIFFLRPTEEPGPVRATPAIAEPLWPSAAEESTASPLASAPMRSMSAGERAQAEREDRLAEDPVAQHVPMLFNVRKEMQLETLRWLEHVPEDKVVAAIPSLLSETQIPMAMRRELALEIIADLIADLEHRGVGAPRIDHAFVAARLTSSDRARESFDAPLGRGSDRDPATIARR